jgi:uncharacterized metal-binding protein YceD (DUF177 family)
MTQYDKVYNKDPFSLTLDIRQFRGGEYQVKGEASPDSMKMLCERIGVDGKGTCSANVVFSKAVNFEFKTTGTIDLEVERTCIRSLKPFMHKETLTLNEVLKLSPLREGEDDDLLETDQLNVGDYLSQLIIVYMDAYPIHPKEKNKPAGSFNVDDGIQDEVDEEKNPFSVLKSLKSD